MSAVSPGAFASDAGAGAEPVDAAGLEYVGWVSSFISTQPASIGATAAIAALMICRRVMAVLISRLGPKRPIESIRFALPVIWT